MRPNQLVVRSYFARGAKLWFATRAALTALFLMAGFDPLRLSATTLIGIVVLTAALGYVDVRRRRERALLGNLGVSPLALGAFLAGPPIVGETALWLGVAVLA